MSIITTQEHLDNLVTAALHRELEIYQYQINVDNYVMMLAMLPEGEWPAELENYRAASVESMPTTVSDEDIQTVSDYQYRDRLRGLLRTERLEQNKSIRVRDALKVQIGTDYTALVSAKKDAGTAQ